MKLKDIRSQIYNLRENSESFLDPADPDHVWVNDIKALDAVREILDRLEEEGYTTSEEAISGLQRSISVVDTPAGQLKVEPKGAMDEYPGLWVSLVAPNGEDVCLTMVEYDSCSKMVAVRVYADPEIDDPTDSIQFEWTGNLRPITSKEEFRLWVMNNYRMPSDSLAPEMFDGILDMADKMSTEEKREFFAEMIPSIPSYILDRINY